MGGDGLRHIKGFAEANLSLIRVDLYPQHVGEFGQIDRIDGGDFHGAMTVDGNELVLEYREEIKFAKSNLSSVKGRR